MAKDTDGLSDPYAVIELVDNDDMPHLRHANLDDSSTVKVSHVVKGTLNPVWNQDFVFENVKPKKQNLNVSFWDSDDPDLAHTVGSVRNLCATSVCRAIQALLIHCLLLLGWTPPLNAAGPTQVNGFSGFKRMLTDTKKALLCASESDDFLGWVQVDLGTVPSQGASVTLEMQQRSAGSHVGGTVEVE